jgi:hypothetical protein
MRLKACCDRLKIRGQPGRLPLPALLRLVPYLLGSFELAVSIDDMKTLVEGVWDE